MTAARGQKREKYDKNENESMSDGVVVDDEFKDDEGRTVECPRRKAMSVATAMVDW